MHSAMLHNRLVVPELMPGRAITVVFDIVLYMVADLRPMVVTKLRQKCHDTHLILKRLANAWRKVSVLG